MEHHVRTRRLFLKRDEGVRYLEGGRHNRSAEGRVVHVFFPVLSERSTTVPSKAPRVWKNLGFLRLVHGRYGKERHDDGQSFHFMMRGSMPAFLHRDLREG